LIPTFSPQGDGNSPTPVRPLRASLQVDPYLFPARGRKLMHPLGSNQSLQDYVDPYLFPARGRKPRLTRGKTLAANLLIPTFSPQGDGNHVISLGIGFVEVPLIPTFSPQGDGNIHLNY